LGKKGDKSWLLKVTVNSDKEKVAILWCCTRLCQDSTPGNFHNIYITPDLTPQQHKENKALRNKLAEINKDGNFYRIKNQTDCTEGEVKSFRHAFPTNFFNESVTNLNSLLCLQTNARSIFNKVNELQQLVSQHTPHIIGITETWLNSSIKASEIYLDNYNIF